MKRRDIVFMASRDWHGLPLQTHFLARHYAELGHRVFYINQTLQKWPKLSHLLWRLRPRREAGNIQSTANICDKVTPITLWVGPPTRWLRPLNRMIIRRGLSRHDIVDPVFVTYVPTWNAVDIIGYLRPSLTAYLNYHNFDADDVLPDLLQSEKALVGQVDILFTDSLFLQERIRRLSGRDDLERSLPGVDYAAFRAAWRGDETERRRTIYYFGEIGRHIDLELYNNLAEDFEVVFYSVVNPAVRDLISDRIDVRPPVSIQKLPEVLREADILTSFYLDSPYLRAVIPSKFFECMATGKPYLVTGLAEARHYDDIVYNVDGGPERARAVIAALPETETPERLARRDAEARRADWPERFKHFAGILEARESARKESAHA